MSYNNYGYTQQGKGSFDGRNSYSRPTENRWNSYESNDNAAYEEQEQVEEKIVKEEKPPRTQEEKDAQKIKYKYGTKPAKEYFKDANLKAWRMIIRNLPYQTTKEDVQNVCSGFGLFSDIVLPPSKKRKTGCAGFAFVQFKKEEDAHKAKDYFNSNKFKGNLVAADWAIAKDTYETSVHQEKERLKEKVKVEKDDDDHKFSKSHGKKEAKQEEEDSDEEMSDGSDRGPEIDSDEDLSDEGDEHMDEDEGSELSDEDEMEVDDDDDDEDRPKSGKKHTISKADQAVNDGRVVFLRNLNFSTDEEGLKTSMSKYGTVELAILCKFHDSGHSKGTAFVHFSTADEAASCIKKAEDFSMVIDDRMINASLAVQREKAVEIEKEKLTKVPNDNRNLRLLRFGLIREGTSAAKGMSAEDSSKRFKLAQATRKKLENLTMFVSPVRLVVHNLPTTMTNDSLKSICKNAAGPQSFVKEARIWRDMQKLNAKGEGKSKGFAFVCFSEHADALKCLETLNNNPDTFTNEKRPIVEFSIENIAALQAKERRITHSKGEKVSSKVISEKVKEQVKASIGKIHASGMKFLPKNLGRKMRHRNMSKNKKKKLGIAQEPKQKGSTGKGKSVPKVAGNAVSKQNNRANKNALKKNTTKYLTLS